MESKEPATPIKAHNQNDELGITTPSGGRIFNPFHKEFLSRVDKVTFSPGIFAYNPSPIGKRDSRKNTPSRPSIPFALSPDVRGDLFPADIDENPTLQLQLQERLDTQCDDDVQDTIHSFFKSHLIAPSPDTITDSFGYRQAAFPRTSSLLPAATPKGKKKSTCLSNQSPQFVSEVAVQTALSVPVNFNFEDLIRKALGFSDHNNLTGSSHTTMGNSANPVGEDSLKESDIKCNFESISLTACAVHRPHRHSSLSRHASGFSRRSLFSDSSDIVGNIPTIERELPAQNTLVPLDAQPILPTIATDLASPVRVNPESSINQENMNATSLFAEAAASQLALPMSWAQAIYSSDEEDNDHSIMTSSHIVNNDDSLDNIRDTINSSLNTQSMISVHHYINNGSPNVDNEMCMNSIRFCSPDFVSQKNQMNNGNTNFTDKNHISFHSPNLSPILSVSKRDPFSGFVVTTNIDVPTENSETKEKISTTNYIPTARIFRTPEK